MRNASNGNGLAGLASRLTDPHDRETYANLITYAHSLPPGDEFQQLVQLLGLLSLLGQRLPDAVAEFLEEFRAQTASSVAYHVRLEERLAGLPGEISAGVDVAAMAKAMSEAFRQQLAGTGLQESAALLRSASKEITALSGEISAAVKPAAREYQAISGTLSAELTQLIAAAKDLARQNAQMIAQKRSDAWWWQSLVALVLFFGGGLFGIVLEKRYTTDVLTNVEAQIQRIQMSALPAGAAPEPAVRKGRVLKRGAAPAEKPATPVQKQAQGTAP